MVAPHTKTLYISRMTSLLSRITIQPQQCHGQPCIRGMRIRVTDILEMLAGGMTHEQVLKDYPYLEGEDISAALAYAAREISHPVVTVAE